MTILDEHCMLHVVWCDDIRQEVGNKPSFMGVYNHLGVPSVPFVLSRLGAFVTLYTPLGRPLSTVILKVMKSDEEKEVAFVELSDLGAAVVANAHGGPNDPEDQPTVRMLSVAMLLGNIQINESTKWLRVDADIGGERFESLRLRILQPVAPPLAA